MIEDPVLYYRYHFSRYPLSSDILTTLLQDHTTGKPIIWATDSYAKYKNCKKDDSIISSHILSSESPRIIPRFLKSMEDKQSRTKKNAEVFTPSWICNRQNNLIDEAEYGLKNMFNKESGHSWIPTKKVNFGNRDWKEYVSFLRMEITCGEAPYLVSRFDTTSGRYIKVHNRIGLLDRKLRVVLENAANPIEWLTWTTIAMKSTYGYEYQGDNLLIARANLLYDFLDFYEVKMGHYPKLEITSEIANIISWNIWQMDGFTNCPPGDNGSHPCLIQDWDESKPVTFQSLIEGIETK